MQRAEFISDAPPEPASAPALPWYCYAVVVGVACLSIGIVWDISWHITIGRDTFWAPAHILIQLGGIIPGLVFGWLAWTMTFGSLARERVAGVSLWGARAPLGAWVTIWGAVAMVTSAPFDDWWHNAYGLDVKIVSPPHMVLGVGMFAVAFGVLLFVHSWQNRLASIEQAKGALLCTAALGFILMVSSTFLLEYTWPNLQHGALFYKLTGYHFPLLLLLTARASQRRWSATLATSIYVGIMLVLIWVLPLFRAHPKLAPIYNPVDHMAPPTFPLLLIVPAVAIDLLARWLAPPSPTEPTPQGFWQNRGRDWMLALLSGTAFILLFFGTQWVASKFLLSPSAENRFFGGNHHWPYYVHPGDWMTEFWDQEKDPVTPRGLAIAWGLACLSARLGLWFGNWLLKVKR